jgi:hypothetical protein
VAPKVRRLLGSIIDQIRIEFDAAIPFETVFRASLSPPALDFRRRASIGFSTKPLHRKHQNKLRRIQIRVYTYFVSSMSPLIWIMPAIMSGLFFVYSRLGGTGTTALPRQVAIFSCVIGNGTRWQWDSVAMGLGGNRTRKTCSAKGWTSQTGRRYPVCYISVFLTSLDLCASAAPSHSRRSPSANIAALTPN